MTEEVRVCPTCKLSKSPADFHKQRDKKDGLRSQCKSCTNKKNLAKYHECPETKRSHHKASRKHSLWKNYGVTLEQYDQMLSNQGGACLICRSTKTWGFIEQPKRAREFFCVDHDHSTGKVRGLLCQPCNTGLGSFKDNPDYLRAAIKYLEGE